MASSEKLTEREILRRMRIGWDYLESERLQNLASVVTTDALPALESSFAYAQTLPARMNSGFVAFYQVLGRKCGRCSILSAVSLSERER